MRIFRLQYGDLMVDGSAAYLYSTWATPGTYYPINSIVRYQKNTVWFDWRAKYSHTSNVTWYPGIAEAWEQLGESALTTPTYMTNVVLSHHPTWTTGVAVTADETVFDQSDHRDYIAPNAILAADNTIRPSAAIRNSDEDIAARWSVLGPANAWAPYDKEVFTKLVGTDATGANISPVTMSFYTSLNAVPSHVILAGMDNVKKVTAAVGYGGVTHESPSATLTPAVTHLGRMPHSCLLALTHASYTVGLRVRVNLTLEAHTSDRPIKLGYVGLGTEWALADTEWGLDVRMLSFSRKERDETYGTIKFLKRGSARQLTANCYYDPAVISGDSILQLLETFDGIPCLMDFNNTSTGSNYDRLRIFGFYTDVKTGIHGLSYETLHMSVESLVQ